MTVEVEIINRVYYGIEEFCQTNGLDINEYLSEAIMDRYNIDKYGDLNEKLAPKPKKEDIVEEPKKKPGRLKEIKEEETDNGQDVTPQAVEESKTEPIKAKKEQEEPIQMEEHVDGTDTKPVKKIRRTLKTK